ncbi:hypothetical protein OSB04_026817 [Centaurea solstitialis]|uniref:Methyltransferase-like protein 13 n=1 Tax=Centaurea solstitialis TaxID=347529 RepID=A0AA38SPN9_9ASTR|nr:hypothetical protein OSB04_026817 [Centaurea solstitialis]
MPPLEITRIPHITGSQFFTFTVPNPIFHDCHLRSPLLRVAVLDTPHPRAPPPSGDLPIVVAMIVPPNRESDWIFSTEAGQFQILQSYTNVARLVLIGNNPQPNSPPVPFVRSPASDSDEQLRDTMEDELISLVVSLHPNICFQDGMFPEPEFLTFEDPTLYSVILNRFMGRLVGEFLVEDVEVERKWKSEDDKKDFRRRLRFKRTPKTIQSEVPLVPASDEQLTDVVVDLMGMRKLDEVEFRVDPTVLVSPHLVAMVAGVSLIAPYIDQRIRNGFAPRALCLGVGGGALLTFLKSQLGFQVVGVESDEVVMNVGRRYFGLVDSISLQLVLGDAIEFLEKFSRGLARRNPLHLPVSITMKDDKYDAIMVDLDFGDAGPGSVARHRALLRGRFFSRLDRFFTIKVFL